VRRFVAVLLTAVLLTGLGVGATFADVLPPGQTPPPPPRYSVSFYLVGRERFPDVEFFLYPVNMTGMAVRVVPEQRNLLTDWYKLARPSLYAVQGPLKAGASDAEAFRSARRLASCEASVCARAMVWGAPTAAVKDVHIYMGVKALEGSELKIGPVREEHFDARGRLLKTLARPGPTEFTR
jgi:hypothetical protein